jgi:hypothetical protein
MDMGVTVARADLRVSQKSRKELAVDYRHILGTDLQESCETIRQHTTLDTAIEHWTIDLDSRDFGAGGDITDCFQGKSDVYGETREDGGAIHRQLEGVNPEEGDCGRGLDTAGVDISSCSSDDASDWEID